MLVALSPTVVLLCFVHTIADPYVRPPEDERQEQPIGECAGTVVADAPTACNRENNFSDVNVSAVVSSIGHQSRDNLPLLFERFPILKKRFQSLSELTPQRKVLGKLLMADVLKKQLGLDSLQSRRHDPYYQSTMVTPKLMGRKSIELKLADFIKEMTWSTQDAGKITSQKYLLHLEDDDPLLSRILTPLEQVRIVCGLMEDVGLDTRGKFEALLRDNGHEHWGVRLARERDDQVSSNWTLTYAHDHVVDWFVAERARAELASKFVWDASAEKFADLFVTQHEEKEDEDKDQDGADDNTDNFWVGYQLSMGGEGSRTNLHFEVNELNFIAVVEGRKAVAVINPSSHTARERIRIGEYCYLGAFMCMSKSASFEERLISQLWRHCVQRVADPVSLEERFVYPTQGEELWDGCQIIILTPGQGATLPPYHWHLGINLEATVGIGLRASIWNLSHHMNP